ncbi:Ketopantoate hydroxymethyltransferase [Micromonospora echinospora]|uniref:3-methyl-2-oxobutanoate hydroxymethyltransferase n=1 Tax=Micromonospora echinospora TaxID=1877 RepID=A0A1C4YT54_MICEC|nr:Ketopantoate hydroxymethyltransferase [Micromonospora echinospora]
MSGGFGSLYGVRGRRLTSRDLAAAKKRGELWAMLAACDALTARVSDEVGVPALLVGDSAASRAS